MTYHLTLPDGSTIYHVPHLDHGWGRPTDDHGRDCDWRQGTGWKDTGVVHTPEATTSVTFYRDVAGPVLDYTLADPDLASVRWPLTIDPDTYAGLDEDDQVRYRARRADATAESQVIDLTASRPWPIDPDDITPRPTPPDGARWHPASAWALVFGIPTHDHLVPGYLTGFHTAARTLLDAQPHRASSWLASGIRIENGKAKDIEFRFLHADGLTHTVKQGRRRMKRPTHESIRVTFDIGPDAVGGATMADAIIAWESRLADLLAQVPEPSLVCATCRGLGFVRTTTTETP